MTDFPESGIRLSFPDRTVTSAQLKMIARLVTEEAGDRADIHGSGQIVIDGILPSKREVLLGELAAAGVQTAGPAGVEPADVQRDTAGIREQSHSELFSIGIPVPLARLSGAQLRKAADAAERYGVGTIRLTKEGVLVFPDVSKEKVANLLEGLQGVGLGVDVPAIVRGASVCVDTPFQGGVVNEAKRFLKGIVDHLQARVPLSEPFSIRLCAHTHDCSFVGTAHIGLAARRPEGSAQTSWLFDLTAGGRPVAQGISGAEIIVRLEHLLAGYKKSRKPGEDFHLFCARVGEEHLQKISELAHPEPDAVA
ncbi:MAG: hypothetical protein NC910_01155 [Candidatus Omnitrophica bacterium]|nr:hypothetical protein [Candidatus Omnitrophota bacterium]